MIKPANQRRVKKSVQSTTGTHTILPQFDPMDTMGSISLDSDDDNAVNAVAAPPQRVCTDVFVMMCCKENYRFILSPK